MYPADVRSLLALVLIALAGTAAAGPYEDGVAASERGDYAAAMALWRPLADEGNVDAQYRIAVLYDLGRGVAQDYAAAVRWYRLAADKGHANAQHNLATMYEMGEGVEPDYALAAAIVWFRRAAMQGYAPAQCSLGVMYALGRGVRRDDIEAYKWLTLAMASQSAQHASAIALAKKNRDLVALRITPHQASIAERHARDFQPKLER
ncbi:MAG TPA: tetratricopeptide repeat protein, partial [Reyranellaceae bacterium]|nr:tetratricopeptide repeat protein [Reyranellaceae bacterium]